MSAGGASSLPKTVREVAEGFFNIRGHFKVIGGLIDLGTHMSLLRLSSGRYLVVDTIGGVGEGPVKAWLDGVTRGGELIEAVLATHPFHTLFFPTFHKLYPQAPYYGTPRHLRVQPDLPWAGSITDVLDKWEPEVSMRVPAGAEFVNPDEGNHFSAVFVLHRASRTMHVDDTVMYVESFSTPLWLAGFKPNTMHFHPSLKGVGLLPGSQAPLDFGSWVEALLKDWDFNNICTAHVGNKVGGAKEQLSQTLARYRPVLQRLADERRRKEGQQQQQTRA